MITATAEPARPSLAELNPALPIELSPRLIAQGLTAAIAQGITPEDDPVIDEVRSVLAQVDSGRSLIDAAEAQGVNVELLEALALLGQEQFQFDPSF